MTETMLATTITTNAPDAMNVDDDAASVNSDQSNEPTLEEKLGSSNVKLSDLNIDLSYRQTKYDNVMSYASSYEEGSKQYPSAKVRDAIEKLEKAKKAKQDWLDAQKVKQEAKDERKRARMDASREEKMHFELMDVDRLKRFDLFTRTYTKRAKIAAADAVVAEKKRDPNATKEQLDDIVDKAFKNLHNKLSFPLPEPVEKTEKPVEKTEKSADKEADKPAVKKEE
tara:strand:- start:61 stop:738 length:678 start_codon:yes stop_codon:yes gene_type:complete